MTTRKPRYGDIFAGHDEGVAMAEHANILWETYKADLIERGLWTSTRAQTLDRLVRYRVEHDHYHPIVVSEGPVKRGKNGDYVNIKWSMVQKLADRCDKLEKALTLTPESAGEKGAQKAAGAQPPAARKYLDRAKAH